MNYKIVLGVIIPLLIIVGLTVISSLDIGFTVQETYIEEISLSEIYQSGQLLSTIKIADISITNDYFLGKRYSLPDLRACVDDIEGSKSRLNAGSLKYSEGEYDPNLGKYAYGDLINYPSTNTYGSRRSVEIGSNSEKKIRIYLEPSSQFRYKTLDELTTLYGDYDRLMIYKASDTSSSKSISYYGCTGLNDEALQTVVYITLTS